MAQAVISFTPVEAGLMRVSDDLRALGVDGDDLDEIIGTLEDLVDLAERQAIATGRTTRATP